jgi:hypothetical protein
VTPLLTSRSERVSNKGTSQTQFRTYRGVYDMEAEQVKAHSLGRVDTVLAYYRTRMGECMDKPHHKFIEGAKHID